MWDVYVMFYINLSRSCSNVFVIYLNGTMGSKYPSVFNEPLYFIRKNPYFVI